MVSATMLMVTSIVMMMVVVMGTAKATKYPVDIHSPTVSSDEVTCQLLSRDQVLCQLHEIVRHHDTVLISVDVNVCNEPADFTFKIKTAQELFRNFTFVPSNQNARLLVPNLYLRDPIPRVPIYLYIREPTVVDVQYKSHRHRGRNVGIYVTIQASLVAILSNMWEEVEFLNHTFHVPHKTSNCEGMDPAWGFVIKAASQIFSFLLLLVLIPVIREKCRQRRNKAAAATASNRANERLRRNEDSPESSSQNSSTSANNNDDNNSNNVGNDNDGTNNNITVVVPKDNPQNNPPDGDTGVELNRHSVDDNSASLDSGNAATLDRKPPIIQKFNKLKRNLEVGLKGITFKKLREDGENDGARGTERVDVENETGNEHFQGSAVIKNPIFLSKIISKPRNEHPKEVFPLDDDISAGDECSYSNKGFALRSDSYSNIFHISDSGNDAISGCDFERQNGDILSSSRDRNAFGINGTIGDNINSVDVDTKGSRIKNNSVISHAAKNGFGYGSKEWLNQLEGATSFSTDKLQFAKKKKSKVDKAKHGAQVANVRKQPKKISKSTSKDFESDTGDKPTNSGYHTDGCLTPPYPAGNSAACHEDGKTAHDADRKSNDQLHNNRVLTSKEVVAEVLSQGFFNFADPSESANDEIATASHLSGCVGTIEPEQNLVAATDRDTNQLVSSTISSENGVRPKSGSKLPTIFGSP